MQKKCVNLLLCSAIFLSACTQTLPPSSSPALSQSASPNTVLVASGQWLRPADLAVDFYLDPQPSGLTWYEGQLAMIADASAHASQIKRLHFIDPVTALVSKTAPYTITASLTQNCFVEYLTTRPDLEALVKDPFLPDTFITVTEDASTLGELTAACQARFSATHSTEYPTVLVRLTLSEGGLKVVGTRAVQFPEDAQVGNFPNDGVEGLAIANHTLYLGLEKDKNNQARVFTTTLDTDFWQQTGFVRVQSHPIDYPNYNLQGPNPINALEIFVDRDKTWLLAAARNDNELWITNLADTTEMYRVKLAFLAPNYGSGCEPLSQMDNASLEGIAVHEGMVYTVNDPWKKNYHKNITCTEMRPFYAASAPLLFKIPLAELWRHAQRL